MRNRKSNFFVTKKGIILAGSLIAIFATSLQKLGNPPNMGVCVACFERDIAGALGLHRVPEVQYMRPEIIGIVLGSFISALLYREFRPRGGSSPIVRFVLGIFGMIGALVFLGCPWRTLLRLSGGDLNAIFGLLGLISGIWVGTVFLNHGYNLGRFYETPKASGFVMPSLMLAFLILMLIFPQREGLEKSGILFYSVSGPGAMHAEIKFSLIFGALIGFLAQRSRFCTVGGIRDFILFRQTHLLLGVISLFIVALLSNLFLKQFKLGFENQPIAHTIQVWNFLGMALSGLCFTLAGGCPGRQLFLAGEGDGDAAIFVLGMIVGAAIAHNFGIASSAKGIGPYGPHAVLIGFIVTFLIGIFMRESERR